MTLLRFAFGNWFSRTYLLGVLGVALWVTFTLVSYDGPDANLAGVWLIFATLPGSMVLTAFTDDVSRGLFIAGIVFGALLNAAVIGGIVHLARRGRTGPGQTRPVRS
jgi:hypothetical protein